MDYYTNQRIFENIRFFRKLRGIKSTEIARMIGMSQGNYSKLENGQLKNYLPYLITLSKILNIDIDEFFLPNKLISNDLKKPDKQSDQMIKHFGNSIKLKENTENITLDELFTLIIKFIEDLNDLNANYQLLENQINELLKGHFHLQSSPRNAKQY